ncbi:DnaJ domain-containing protein [Alkaliphilus sp. MSJ-5]|uniref:DnaJ domain-containing protein n=1 Tax=Alkaliphilus flagellatus TaxID=2841507 RepID=A0ABS6FYZ4_9FIRM|nr:DnaJ domain-containing protein [Alkaliphilus flagellatus]MBU5675284.1 DnaJ domain-containing protein [Alkaliphilus flagellatus]
MKIIKKISGKILYGTAKVISAIIDGLIHLIENIVLYTGKFLKGCLVIVSMGGCLLFLLFANLGFRILANPIGFLTILILLGFLMLGGKLASYLKYQKYIITEFLFNTANYLMDEEKYKYKTFNHYKEAYKRAEEERIREEQRRYYEQQRQWEERFKQQWYQQNYQRGQGGYGGYGSQGSYGQGYVNPTVDFKNKYERSCDILGVSYDADKQQIKSAYRRKAKEYHPDLSKLPDATKRFQEITAAYEFLSDDNIQRYKNI